MPDMKELRRLMTPQPEGKCCKTCHWSRWQLTAHKPPRPNLSRPGFCEWPMPELPAAFGIQRFWRASIWADMGKLCPQWKVKEDANA